MPSFVNIEYKMVSVERDPQSECLQNVGKEETFRIKQMKTCLGSQRWKGKRHQEIRLHRRKNKKNKSVQCRAQFTREWWRSESQALKLREHEKLVISKGISLGKQSILKGRPRVQQ